ncbi:MAG TPA: hypothetical protein VHM26_17120 [Chitinophagaceae bacterium]|nr:hypothetical protein [Chitinophagaceae bacterium]
MLYNRHEDIFEKIDFEDDNIYMEPLLFSYVFQDNNKWLDSIIYGYMKEKPESILVFSNRNGIVYLPLVGYFYTDLKSAEFTLRCKDGEYILLSNNGPINYKFAPIYYLEFGVELLLSLHPLFEPLFTEQNVAIQDIDVENVWEKYIPELNEGLKIVSNTNPDFFDNLKKNLKKILLFDGAAPYPFAGMKAHNMVFLNVRNQGRKLFFADRVSHEGGHVLFFSLTYESKYNLFKCPPETPFSQITQNGKDHGLIYLRFHGLFTYLSILSWLLQYPLKYKDNKKEMHEIKGRTLFHFSRFETLLDKFLVLDIFEEEGQRWMKIFRDFLDRNRTTYQELSKLYSIEEQPYDFEYGKFKQLNPIDKYEE